MIALSCESAGLLPGQQVLQQYGALPWRKDRRRGIQVLLVTSRTHGRWSVPKGRPMADRASYLAAALEAFEGAGVIGDIRTTPLAGYDTVKIDETGAGQDCHVTLFALRVIGTLTHWPEKDQRQRRWLSLSQAADLADDAGLARILRSIRASPDMLEAEAAQREELAPA